MKRIILPFIYLIFFSTLVKAQYVIIPDTSFRNYIRDRHPSCFNSSGMMDTTCSDLLNEKQVTITGIIPYITNLDGIQYLKSLTYLKCSFSNVNSLPSLPQSLTYLDCSASPGITVLPLLSKSLTYLNCSGVISLKALPGLPSSLTYLNCSLNSLVNLPALPVSLQYLNCSQNQITALPTLPNSLKFVDCSANSITGSLAALPSSLTYFNCSSNQFSGSMPTLPGLLDSLICGINHFTSLPSLPPSLVILDCSSDSLSMLPTLPASLLSLNFSQNKINNLTDLPLSLLSLNCDANPLNSLPSLPSTLVSLACGKDQLISLPILPASLTQLSCYGNFLTSLPLLPAKLQSLECENNQLTTLPVLPNLLQSLSCRFNQLTSLPVLPDTLNTLYCESNNIYCFPSLPRSLSFVSFDEDKIRCIPNYPPGNFLQLQGIDSIGVVTSYRVDQNPYFLCNPTNNVNNCQSFPIISGTEFYDNNSNGIKDAGELYRPFVKLDLSDGSSTFTNNNGYYETAVISGTGNYTLTTVAPNYYKAVPASTNYNFTSFDTLVTQSVALQPTALIDSISIWLTSYHRNARPGFDFPVEIDYSNVGTTTFSSSVITIQYDNQRLIYESSSNGSVINNGSNLTLPVSNFVPGESGKFVIYFTAKTTDVLGDSIKTAASITANASILTDSIVNLISGSLDPNGIDATPVLTPGQVAAGTRINYTIHFQNTGSDTAFNIVVADTLSDLLQAGTLQITGSSRPCRITVNNNVVFFEFLNILLPDNKTNDIASSGYVSFSVVPQISVSSGSVNNSAFIYFDYNMPIGTNIGMTRIQNPDDALPLQLISFKAIPQQDNKGILLYWITAAEINTKSFIIEQSRDGVNFYTLVAIAAKQQGEHNYSYIVPDNVSTVYYRLKITDIDGQYMYSQIVKVTAHGTEEFVILNNPIKDYINIKTASATLNNTTALIINNSGRVVKQFILHTGTQLVDIRTLPSGIYYLKTQLKSLKIIIGN